MQNPPAYAPQQDPLEAQKAQFRNAFVCRMIAFGVLFGVVLVCSIVALENSRSVNIFNKDTLYLGTDVKCISVTSGICEANRMCLLCTPFEEARFKDGSIEGVSIPSIIMIILSIVTMIWIMSFGCCDACKPAVLRPGLLSQVAV